MSNQRRLRPHQRAAQDQALAAARDAAAEHGAVIVTYEMDPGTPCVYAEAHDTQCLGAQRHGVRVHVHGVDERLDYAACAGHVWLVLQTAVDALRRSGIVGEFDLKVDQRLDGAAVP